MERSDWSAVAHAGLDVMNPLPPPRLDELLDVLELERGARVVDLGCGKGELLRRIADRYAIEGLGVENSPALLAEARTRGGSGLKFVEADLTAFATDAPFDLASAVGAGAGGDYRQQLARLASLVRRGGLVLLGEGYWRSEPDETYLAALGATVGELADYAGTIRAGEELGLTPLYAVAASVEDFDRYEWRWALNGERYAAANPDEPGIEEFLAWVRNGRRRYVELGGRATLGFGLFLFVA
jgi:trans-aconitate methyltransferase